MCFFCGIEVTTREKLTKAASAVLSKYKEIGKNVAESIKSRGFDRWAFLVFGRIERTMICMLETPFNVIRVIPILKQIRRFPQSTNAQIPK